MKKSWSELSRYQKISLSVLVLGAFFAVLLFTSLFQDPRLRCQIHKWKYEMTEEQVAEYHDQIAQTKAENEEISASMDEKIRQKDETAAELNVYRTVYETYNSDKILSETLASIYQQSTASAIECKAIILESFGMDTGIKYFTEEDGGDGSQEIKDYVLDEAAGRLASGTAGDILKSGVNGALDGWSSDGSLSAVLEGVGEGLESGVAAAIDDVPKKVAAAFLGDSLVSAAEAVAGFGEIDVTSAHLLNSIAREMETSSAKLMPCLENEQVTEEGLYEMIYWYFQYAKSASAMNNYSGGRAQTEILGEAYQVPLSIEYSNFVRNEALLRLLGAGGNDEIK